MHDAFIYAPSYTGEIPSDGLLHDVIRDRLDQSLAWLSQNDIMGGALSKVCSPAFANLWARLSKRLPFFTRHRNLFQTDPLQLPRYCPRVCGSILLPIGTPDVISLRSVAECKFVLVDERGGKLGNST